MRKNIALIALISFMFVIGLQVAEPVAAASLKVIDHYSTKFKDGNTTVTYTWTTYKNGENYVVMKGTYYPVINSWKSHYYMYLQKTSKTKIKITEKIFSTNIKTGKTKIIHQTTYYHNTKLTAVKYYWKVIAN
jgi:hypothetical protein